MSEKKFRWDIQGLRAIAVLAVVIFHISPEHLPGGYLGVDIFFVISGFLIIGFIDRDLKAGTFSLSDFYYRRVKRLMPAYLATIIGTSIFASLYFIPQEFASYMKSLLSTLTYVSNFYFYSESGYFDSSLKFAPLLHTWSLSVEEQFYILIPITLLLLYKSGKSVVFWLSVIFAVSLLFSIVCVFVNPDFAFFASPSRFWQFILGGLMAIKLKNVKLKSIYFDLIGAAGLLITAYCLFFYTGATSFPGINAIVPTLAAAMIIFSGFNDKGIVTWVMSNKIGVFLGNISYSLYLWHWPVIVFYKLSVTLAAKPQDKIIMLIVSIVLGYLSWLLVERNGKFFFPKAKNYSLAVASVVGVYLGSLALQHYSASTFTEEQKHFASYLEYDGGGARVGTCFVVSGFGEFNENECVDYREGSKNYVLIGDSHAAHWYDALVAQKAENETISQVTASGCMPVIPLDGRERCTELVSWAFDDLLPRIRFDKVLLSARWEPDNIPKIKATLEKIKPLADQIIVMGPTVEYDTSLPRVLALNRTEEEFSRHRLYEKVKKIDAQLEAEVSKVKGVRYISVFKILCPAEDQCTSTTDDLVPIAFDYGHFTEQGAGFVLRQIEL